MLSFSPRPDAGFFMSETTCSMCSKKISLDDQDDILCNGDNTGSITVSATGGVPPYMYSLNGGTPQSSGSFDDLIAGAYNVIVTDDNGNSAFVSVTLTEPDAISIQITKRQPTGRTRLLKY